MTKTGLLLISYVLKELYRKKLCTSCFVEYIARYPYSIYAVVPFLYQRLLSWPFLQQTNGIVVG
jgi:hypothetical protein